MNPIYPVTLEKEGKTTEAIIGYQKWIQDAPNDLFPLDRLVWLYRCNCMWDALEEIESKWLRMIQDGHRNYNPFNLNSADSVSADLLSLATMRNADWIMQRKEDETWPEYFDPMQIRPKPVGEKLRIGYLCGGFQADHPTVRLAGGVFAHHDLSRFDVRFYSWGQKPMELPDYVGPYQYDELYGYPDNAAAALIFHDGIDILVDLSGYSAGIDQEHRVGILAHRPAPIIVNYLGYPGSIGSDNLADYIIADHDVIPQELRRHYSENIAYLPRCYQPNDDQLYMPKPTFRPKDEQIVFCSLNQMFKITRKRFALWCRILRDTPGSCLWLLRISGIAQSHLRAEAERHGVAGSRIQFQPWISTEREHIDRLMSADIMLDTSSYGSHTTASDAIRAGLPIVTIMGETFASRACGSIVKASGFVGGLCKDEEEYYQRAVYLAKNAESRKITRALIFGYRNRTKGLYDTLEYTRDLEMLYTEMWKRYQKGHLSDINFAQYHYSGRR